MDVSPYTILKDFHSEDIYVFIIKLLNKILNLEQENNLLHANVYNLDLFSQSKALFLKNIFQKREMTNELCYSIL